MKYYISALSNIDSLDFSGEITVELRGSDNSLLKFVLFSEGEGDFRKMTIDEIESRAIFYIRTSMSDFL